MKNCGGNKLPAAMTTMRAVLLVFLLLLMASNEFASGNGPICEKTSRRGGSVYCPDNEDDCAKICVNKEKASNGKCHSSVCFCYFDGHCELAN